MTCALASSTGMFDGQREDSLPRGHDLANGNIVEFDGAMNERLLKTREADPGAALRW